MDNTSPIHKINRNSIARRLLIYILVASSILTLIITTIQLYTDYLKDVNSIKKRLVKINKSCSKVLAQGMWDLDKKQVENMLKGILEFTDIQHLEVVSVYDGVFVQAGTVKEKNIIKAEFPVVYEGNNIGYFNITATLDGVYERLREKVFIILCSQSVKTFFISIFILFIVQFLVTRHLKTMAVYTGKLDINNLEKGLQLQRRGLKNNKPDELQQVVNAINGMRLNLIQDIDIQRKQEQELIYLRNYLTNIIDSMPSILVGVDVDGNVTQWNKTAEFRTGFTVEEAEGKRLFDFLPQLAPLENKISLSIKTGDVIQEQKKLFHTETGNRYEDITIYPLKADGIEGAVIRVDDVTDKVRMEELMVQSEKMLSVGGLAAGMAHEINNPLAGMMQNAEVMKNRMTSKEISANKCVADEVGIDLDALGVYMEKRGILGMIDAVNDSGQRISDIVDNMLNFARKSEAVIAMESIPELLDDTLSLAVTDYDLKREYDFKAVEIIREYENDMPRVACEKTKIQQVFLNIIRNCAQAMQEAKTEMPVLTLRAFVDAGKENAVIEFEDNGPGMDEETCKRIFEPFFTTKPAGVGTGLGLSVSYFIVTDNHNGTMTVESAPGKGAKFIIQLPFQPIVEMYEK